MLDFENISFGLRDLINSYYFKFGESSCQHSFASSFCLYSKYKDMFFEDDGVLYVNRSGLNDDEYRVYLFPMCDRNDVDKVKIAVENIITDAKYYNKKVKFFTITKASKDLIEKLFKDRFKITNSEIHYEYIYKTSDIAELKGSKFQAKRNKVNKLVKTYSNNIVVKKIEDSDKDNIRRLYHEWMDCHNDESGHVVNTEINCLNIALENFDKLELNGVAVYINGEIVGFNFGSRISDSTFDGMIQKCNIKYDGIYEFINRESAKLWADEFKFLNFEEDLGVEGLRKAKQMYHPCFMIEKYIAVEV